MACFLFTTVIKFNFKIIYNHTGYKRFVSIFVVSSFNFFTCLTVDTLKSRRTGACVICTKVFTCSSVFTWMTGTKINFWKKKKPKKKPKKNHRDYKNLLVMNVKGKYKIKERNTFCPWSILDEQIKHCLEIKSTVHSKNSDSLVLLLNQFKCMVLEHTLNQQP